MKVLSLERILWNNFYNPPYVNSIHIVDVIPGQEEVWTKNKLQLPKRKVQPIFSPQRDTESPFDYVISWGVPKVVIYEIDIDKDGMELSKVGWNDLINLHVSLQQAIKEDVWYDARRQLKALGPIDFNSKNPGMEGERIEEGKGFVWEPLGKILAALSTLDTITSLVSFSNSENRDKLAQIFGNVTRWPATEGAISTLTLGGKEDACFPWRIEWKAWYDTKSREYRTPRRDELLRASWEAVLNWYQQWFEDEKRIICSFNCDPKNLSLSFNIGINTLYELAIASFYLTEITQPGICKREGCPNPRPSKRKFYCSPECQQSSRQKRQRDRERGTIKESYNRATARLRKLGLPDESHQLALQKLKDLREITKDPGSYRQEVDKLLSEIK